jgi:hypothetical protein
MAHNISYTNRNSISVPISPHSLFSLKITITLQCHQINCQQLTVKGVLENNTPNKNAGFVLYRYVISRLRLYVVLPGANLEV